MDINYNKISEKVNQESNILEEETPENKDSKGLRSTMSVVDEASGIEPQDIKVRKAIIINCIRLNVRKRGSINSNIISIIHEGDKVTLHPSQGDKWDWVHIILDDSTHGFVMGDYIKEV